MCREQESFNITRKLQHLATNPHRLSSPVNILIFVESNAIFPFFGPLFRSIRILIINTSSSKVPTTTMNIHGVTRNLCKLVIIFYLSWHDISQNVDRPFKTSVVYLQIRNSAELKLFHSSRPCTIRMPMCYLNVFLSIALRTPTAHNFCVITERKWARARAQT